MPQLLGSRHLETGVGAGCSQAEARRQHPRDPQQGERGWPDPPRRLQDRSEGRRNDLSNFHFPLGKRQDQAQETHSS